MPAAETTSSAPLPSEAAPGPATWAGLLLRSLRRLGVEPLQLLRRGGRRAPAGHCVLGHRDSLTALTYVHSSVLVISLMVGVKGALGPL